MNVKRKNVNDGMELIGKGKLYLIIGFGIALIIWFVIYMDSNYRTTLKHTYKYRSQKMQIPEKLYDSTKIIFKGEKIVHLDLKGAPPKITYYKEFFTLIVRLGATGVIIEYEDMFPYSGKLSNISAGNAYSIQDIKTINAIAYQLKLKIIPLVQTFGHLEFLLKNFEFQHLREVIKYPQVICPSNKNTLPLLMEMINQVIKAHPYSTMIHIGADEVYLLGECTKCSQRMYKEDKTKELLFLDHVTTVAKKIKDTHPHLRILVWDDEFRKLKRDALEESDIKNLVEPVVWSYTNDVYVQIGPTLWELYQNIFPKVWIASAYKGATGSNKYLTDVEHHLGNHRSWMQIVKEYSEKIKFEGIILTGWQRYDHFAILCELLPVGIPSLAMCLHHIMGITSTPLQANRETANILQCRNPFALVGPELVSPKCLYRGGDILEGILKVKLITQELNHILDSSAVHGWMTDYNIKNVYSNVFLIESSMQNLYLLKLELNETERNLKRDMEEIYDNYTINEWCNTYLEPIHKKINNIADAKETLLSRDHWPKRPFPLDE